MMMALANAPVKLIHYGLQPPGRVRVGPSTLARVWGRQSQTRRCERFRLPQIPGAQASGHEGPLRYCLPGGLPASLARRNASAIASPVAGAELLRPARVSAGRRGFSDSFGAISLRAVVGRASGASSSRIVNEIRRRFGSTSNTLTRTTSPGFATLRGSL